MYQEITSSATGRKDGSWTLEEHQQFVDGLLTYGKNWNKITQCVPSRSGVQIRSHAQKFFNKLQSQYESRTILGQQSLKIMGLPQNQKQYLVYLNIVQPRINKKKDKRQMQIPEKKNQYSPQPDYQSIPNISSLASDTLNNVIKNQDTSGYSWFVQNVQFGRGLQLEQINIEFIQPKVLRESNQVKWRMDSYASTGREYDSYDGREENSNPRP